MIPPNLQAARLRQAARTRYYGSYIWALNMKPTTKSPFIMSVSQGLDLYFRPDLVAAQPVDSLATIVLHEVYHLILRHFQRGEGKELEPWRLAVDMEVNSRLRREGYSLPTVQGCAPVTATAYGFPENMTAEEYYRLLTFMAETPDDPNGGFGGGGDSGEGDGEDFGKSGGDKGSSEGGEGSGDDEGSGAGDEDSDGEDSDGDSGDGSGDEDSDSDSGGGQGPDDSDESSGNAPGDGPDDGDGKPNDGIRNGHAGSPQDFSGSCADGVRKPWEGEGVGRGREQIIHQKCLQDIASSPGVAPGDLVKMAQDFLSNKTPWPQMLRSILRNIIATRPGDDMTTYSRLSRRGGAVKHRLPGRVTPELNIAVILDSSGSMSEDMTDLALGEVDAVAKGMGYPVRVVTGDTEAHWNKRVTRARQVKVIGGGGTNMGRLIEELDKGGGLSVIIVLTDCETPWCDRPRTPVIVVPISAHGYSRKRIPEWARVIDTREDR